MAGTVSESESGTHYSAGVSPSDLDSGPAWPGWMCRLGRRPSVRLWDHGREQLRPDRL